MGRDTQNKSSNKERIRRSKRVEELNIKKKRSSHFDSDSNSDSNSHSNTDSYDDSESEEELDMQEYRKYIKKIFPSKHIDKKIKAGDRLKKVLEEENAEVIHNKKSKKLKKKCLSDEEDQEIWETASESQDKYVSKKFNKNSKSNKIKETNSEDSSDDDYEEEESEDELVDTEEEEDEKNPKHYELQNSENGKLNIIFTIGGKNEDTDSCSNEDGNSEGKLEDDDTENEDDDVSSDESVEDKNKNKNKNKKQRTILDKNLMSKEMSDENSDNAEKFDEIKNSETLKHLRTLLEANPSDKSIKKCIQMYEQDLKHQKTKDERKCKKQKAKNLRIFKKILKDKNTVNDFVFYEKLELENQKKIIKELREINKIMRIEKPYRMTLLEANIPVEFKSAAMKKINTLRYMEPGSGEFYKNKNWVDAFMRIPFNKFEGFPISINDGVDKCHEFMANAQKTLDQVVYGLNDAKMQIMQMIGQLLTNPSAIGSAIAIHGPMGSGKTNLVKEGISKILNRPFAFIALGGATDSSFLEGHGYTYEGSTWGKIVQILIESKCMNPVIYFDELDKISETPRGEEIAGILTHLTDTTQNSQFHDKYFTEINFDLSKCLFIFSYNDDKKVNPILRDRMYRIKTKGYLPKEKTIIANNYLLPKIREQVRFNEGEIYIANDVLVHIVDNHCNKEDGVRNLKRCLEIIYTKLNLYRLMKPGSNLFEGEMALKVEFPFNVTKEIVDKLIKRETDGLETWRSLYL
jgi:ATP-dependent Lon protease